MEARKREQQPSADRADDSSRDWRKWSRAKCERECRNNPELDANLIQLVAEVGDRFKEVAEQYVSEMRTVDPEYLAGNITHEVAVYAVLANECNLRPAEVEVLPLPVIRGLLLAHQLRLAEESVKQNTKPLTPNEKAVYDLIPSTPEAIQGEQIIQKCNLPISQSTLTSSIIPGLIRKRGIMNQPAAGYYRPA